MEKIPGQIKKLDEAVINRIAAGEVIQRPANALKELLENSLDAGASNISVVVKSGGMKLLQIQDDGSGIRREDLPIVCERFTTSKLEKFEDLQSIGTYGFRGEALASISHVAHLSIITKTRDTVCAYKAEYCDGKLKEYPDGSNQNPKTCAGKQGTIIIVEDLFYNMETRRRALKSVADEHNKIVDVVTKYAIHNARVGFTLKKFGETMTEVRTPAVSTVLDNIKILYGASIARELVEINCEDKQTMFKLNGYVSNSNYSTKKLTFLLFINHRLVDSSALRKSIEAVYYNYLPKGSHPFVYFSIEIDPKNVDVNVHPTKHEVHFLHEDMIVSAITNATENLLLGSNQSRTFMVQSFLPGAGSSFAAISASEQGANSKKDQTASKNHLQNNSQSSPSVAPKQLVRTDPKLQKLDKFLSSTPDPDASRVKNFPDSPSIIVQNSSKIIGTEIPSTSTSASTSGKGETLVPLDKPNQVKRRREIKLRSVRTLREAIEKDNCPQLSTVFKNHTFVGCVDRTLALIQHELSLYIVNTFRLSAELFYQRLLYDFGNFGRIDIEEPITIKELVMMAFEIGEPVEPGKSIEQTAEEIHQLLVGKAPMLEDYFSLSFSEDGKLLSLPLIIDKYYPNMEGMPKYIMNLAKKVNWNDELKCFRSFCHETALFYAVQPGTSEENEDVSLNGQTWKWTIEHIVFPEFKKTFLAPNQFAQDSTVVVLTSLPELYKVFERC